MNSVLAHMLQVNYFLTTEVVKVLFDKLSLKSYSQGRKRAFFKLEIITSEFKIDKKRIKIKKE